MLTGGCGNLPHRAERNSYDTISGQTTLHFLPAGASLIIHPIIFIHMEPEPSNLPDAAVAGGFGKVPQPAESFGSVRQDAADFGNVPKASEGVRTVPPASASFGTVREFIERKENHTLTVREVGRMFEAAGVARSERSIVNWCQANRMGVARLDAYFDPNERKYYITRQSVEAAIQEEIDRMTRHGAEQPEVPHAAEPVRKDAETAAPAKPETDEIKALRQEVMDLKITNRGKDYFIEQMQKEREGLIHQVVESSRKVGELETMLLGVGSGKHHVVRKLPVMSESGNLSGGLTYARDNEAC